MAKVSVIVDEKLLPRAKGFRTAFINGALACHTGRGREANPYCDSHFNRAWDDGWQAAANKKVSFKDLAREKCLKDGKNLVIKLPKER